MGGIRGKRFTAPVRGGKGGAMRRKYKKPMVTDQAAREPVVGISKKEGGVCWKGDQGDGRGKDLEIH